MYVIIDKEVNEVINGELWTKVSGKGIGQFKDEMMVQNDAK